MYPALEWGFVSGKFHTVVVGHEDNWRHPKWVMDILLFRDRTANESLEFAALKNCEFFPHLAEYLTTFATDRKAARQTLLQFDLVPASLRE